ncbi:MAG: thiol-disulfide oxidoreductase DCC family protein [Hyphomicrobiaceae bacterium]|nr:thiol-disulfide oxidoreductase DCC family protein [Hyphomicrobiaceae bacterium]
MKAVGARPLSAVAPYSYRTDPAVPAFPDDKALIVFDGVCVLCSALAGFVLKRDRDFVFRLTTAQSPVGQALFRHYGLDTQAFETNLVLIDGTPYGKLDTLAAVGRRLGGGWRFLAILRLIPRPIGDWLYDCIARNRYHLFGCYSHCPVPEPQWRERFI